MNEKRINAITELTVSGTLKKIDEFLPGAVHLKDGPLGNDFESVLRKTINDAVKAHFHDGNRLQVGKRYKFKHVNPNHRKTGYPFGEVIAFGDTCKEGFNVKAIIKFDAPFEQLDSLYCPGEDGFDSNIITLFNIQDPDIWKIIPEEES